MVDIAWELFEFDKYIGIDDFFDELMDNDDIEGDEWLLAYLLKHDFVNKVTIYERDEINYRWHKLDEKANKMMADWFIRESTNTPLSIYPPLKLRDVYFDRHELSNLDFLKKINPKAFPPIEKPTTRGQDEHPSDPDLLAELEALQAENDQLKAQIATLTAQLDQQQPTQGDTPADPEVKGKSLSTVSKLIFVLLSYAELDITAHSGKTNDQIRAESERLLNSPLGEDTISKWIKNAQQAKIDHGKAK